MNRQTVKAYGKINPVLDVTGRREDGYHLIKMILQTLSVYDLITFTVTDEDEVKIITKDEKLPVDGNNLMTKAVNLLKETYNVGKGMEIIIEKNIPMAAGMAGGSADCAAALIVGARLFGIDADIEELKKLGLALGADVPYCMTGGTVLAQGIGEELTILPEFPSCSILIAKPPIDVSTGYVYKKYDSTESVEHPDVDAMVDAIKNGDLAGICSYMSNVLETVTAADYPVIGQIENVMKESGAINSMMTGSGPTVFGIYERKEDAKKAGEIIVEKGLADKYYVAEPVPSDIAGAFEAINDI